MSTTTHDTLTGPPALEIAGPVTRVPSIEELQRLTEVPERRVVFRGVDWTFYDQLVDSYVDGRVVLIGDAGAVTRPHTGSGATKALQDALCLERLGADHLTWDDLLAAYSDERTSASNAIAELGRRIGHDQVEHTPEWASMTPADFESWTRQTLAGQQLYFSDNNDESDL